MKKNTIQANDMKRARPAPARANRRAGAAAERLLTYVIVLFQISAFSLIALKSQPVDMQALIMAAAFPLGTLLLKMLIDRVWHVDRIPAYNGAVLNRHGHAGGYNQARDRA